MIQHHFAHRIVQPALALALMGTFLALVPGCRAPEPETAPQETVAPATDSETEVADAVTTEEPEEMVQEPSADAEVTIEPPSEEPASELSAVSEVNTTQLAEIVDATTGKVTVLNVWATWCPPCVHETPDLVTFYNETDRDKVAFVSLSIDDVKDISGAIPKFQQEHSIPFPIYVMNERDIDGMVKALRGEFEGVVPTTYLYDQEGKLVETIMGAVTLAELHEKVKPLLSPGEAS